MSKVSYKDAGVDIDAGNNAVDRIKEKVKSTFTKNVLTGIGSFGSLFSLKKIFITLKSDNKFTQIIIKDDGKGYPSEILSKIGEPYLKSNDNENKKNSGLGLGIFIAKNLLEKNFATINCRNSKTIGGAEVIIKWKNEDLIKI